MLGEVVVNGRIEIGRFRLERRTIAVTVEADGLGATVWLERVEPAPRHELGYVVELHTAVPRLHLYRAEWSPELRTAAKAEVRAIWTAAISSGTIEPRPVNSTLVPLGEAHIDGQTVKLTWATVPDTVLIDFADTEPGRIGTVVPKGRNEPAFISQPEHHAWAVEPGRSAQIVAEAVARYTERCMHAGQTDPGALARGVPAACPPGGERDQRRS